MNEMIVTSPAFRDNEMIPVKYTCDGENVNPPLSIDNIPKEAKSLVLIVNDPDAPIGGWIHWIVWNISTKGVIEEKKVPGKEGKNDFKTHHYKGPCPPAGQQHRYVFTVYALDAKMDLDEDSDNEAVEAEMEDNVLATGQIVGVYKKK